jgi:hypothetical protein
MSPMGQKAEQAAMSTSFRFAPAERLPLGIGRFMPPVNNGFAFQRSTRPFFRFFSGGFGACPYLLDTVEEQVATMFLIEWYGIVVA